MGKIPLITIIGVPNTGKSTFFNRVIGKRKALTHSSPGMTRDIYKSSFALKENKYEIQDSGGFFLDENIITGEINKRVFKAAEKSDLIIFLFDGKRELLGYEKDLFLDIIKINDNILTVVNKVDNPEKYILPDSYYSLKRDFIFISAEHNIGFEEVLEEIEKKLAPLVMMKDHAHAPSPTRISIMGKPNVGKSSIINKILNDDFVIVSNIPGTTRDSVDLEIKRDKKTFILVDNAGIRKMQKIKESTESAAVIRAEKDIRNADIVIFVLDASKKIDQNDFLIASKLIKSAKPVIIAANKWDLVSEKENSHKILDKIKRQFNDFYFAPLVLVSAKTGKNIFRLFDLAEDIHKKMNTRIKTAHLNKVVQGILSEKKFLTESNRIFNPKYLSIESYQPFFINFYTGSRNRLKPSFERYLKKRILEELDLHGIPVYIKTSPKKSR